MELKQFCSCFTTLALALLIVPYGIETILSYVLVVAYIPFNRTLWN